jgi:DNA-binding CsgD family transcriptional regulator
VKQHLGMICSKLGASNRTEAVSIALRRHLLKA